ncbi:MAG: DUF3276 family protein [Treponema sp.]|jgi:hypothetical protein|nr:DUF3276 family protein [Treponema sp.]
MMGVRGELFSNRIILPNRTYFFNVKENRMGDLYLNIVESKNRDNGGFDRQSVILFADDLQEFLKGFDESLKVLEKAVREKRQSGREGVKREEKGERKEGYKREENGERKERSFRGERKSERGERSFKGGEKGERRERSFKGGERSDRKERVYKSEGKGERTERNFKGGERSYKSDRTERGRQNFSGEKHSRSRRQEPHSDRKRDKRVVVKKRD